MKKITEITFETEELVAIKARRSFKGFCQRCSAQVEMVPTEVAAMLTGLGEREIFRRIEKGEIHFLKITDKLHIIMQGCIACIIEILFRSLYEESHRISSIRSVGKTTGVNGRDTFYFSEFEYPVPANIHLMNFLDTLFQKP